MQNMFQKKMSRMRCAMAVLGMAFLSAGATGAETEGTNFLPDPGFEMVSSDGRHSPGWSLGEPVFSISGEGARTGSHCLKYKNDDPSVYRLTASDIPGAKPGMRFKFSGWIRGVDLTERATVCLEWYDRDGKWIQGSYPTQGLTGTSPNWVYFSGVTQPLPANTASARLVCFVGEGGTGEAWFDDISVSRYTPPLAEGFATDAYRNVAAGEPVRCRVYLNLEEHALTPNGVAAKLQILPPDGGVNPVAEIAASGIGKEFAEFRIDTAALPVGDYPILVKVWSKDGAYRAECEGRLERLEALPERRVTIDRYKRTLIDGKPFFPLGTYWSRVSPEELALYAQSPFNCLIPYHAPSAEMIDAMDRYGLKLIYSFGNPVHDRAEQAARNRKAIDDYADHPALLAWYSYDEISKYDCERLQADQEMFNELDPDHPVWAVIVQIDDIRDYRGTYNIFGTDPYPIPHTSPAQALQWTRKTVANTGCGLLPVWQVPQIFSWGGGKRPPTFEEMRSMAWQCIAGGADGLIFFSWYHMREEPDFDTRWPEVCRMAAEIREFIPVFLSVEPVEYLPRSVDLPEDTVGWRAWNCDGATYLLVVNGEYTPAEAKFVFDRPPGAVTDVLGSAMTAETDGQTLRVHLKPLEPVMIRIAPER